jgi:hypothetical protein
MEKRKGLAAVKGLAYCTYCCKDHRKEDMVASNGQQRAKCNTSAKRRNSTARIQNMVSLDSKQIFKNEHEANQYMENTEYLFGFQFFVSHTYGKSESNPSNNTISPTTKEEHDKHVLSSLYLYCACHAPLDAPKQVDDSLDLVLGMQDPPVKSAELENFKGGVVDNPFSRFLLEAKRDQKSVRSARKDKNGFFDRNGLKGGCPKRIKITTYETGAVHLYSSTYHSEECQKFAKSGLIIQTISPQLRTWVLNCFKNQFSLPLIQSIIHTKDLHSQYGCPIPFEIGPAGRYRPSTSQLRAIRSEAKLLSLIDQNESKAVDLLVEEMKQNSSVIYYNSGSCTCKVKV